jgi:cyclophilin family peptidyl-prolyl cis-trans isomerase
MTKLIRLLTLMGILSVGIIANAQDAQTPQQICDNATIEEPATREYTEAEDVLQDGVDYRAIFCTEAGAVYVDLLEDYTPVTVNNFVFLAQNDYYNNTTFHRVLENFMAQGGDPTGTGAGGPGYQFQDEFVGFLTFERPGLLAMANAGPGTNGSQFFLTTSEPTYLNYQHTIFGEVLEGYENVLNLRLRDPQANPDFDGASLNTIVIVEDPATVNSTFVDDSEPVAQDVFTGALDELLGTLPAELTLTADSGQFSTDETVAIAPEDVREAYGAMLAENGHEWRITRSVANTACSEQVFFTELRYTVDKFADSASAETALNSEAFGALQTAFGYAGGEPSETMGIPFYSFDTQDCAGADAQALRTTLQRGRYVATVTAVVSNAVLEQIPADVLLNDYVAPQFEQVLSEAYASELR